MKQIPMTTLYTITSKGTISRKVPKYELKTAEDEAEHQRKLGNFLSFYYGLDCKKCCGVYPRYFTTDGFESKGYYVCLVCGKESEHGDMEHLARANWNEGRYEWKPEEKEYQYSIFDFMREA